MRRILPAVATVPSALAAIQSVTVQYGLGTRTRQCRSTGDSIAGTRIASSRLSKNSPERA